MKTIIRIARLELSLLFYSPIAWFLLIMFLFQSGFVYTTVLGNYVTYQELGLYKQILVFLTQKMWSFPVGVLPNLLGKLYLYMPLLTMGLMSREISSGTIKLLYSSPVKTSQIILGKFLSMMTYNVLLVLIVAFYMAVSMCNIESPDYGMLLSALLGIYLLLCAYAAIGLFMSCLTSYQVVAALSTFVIFALLENIGTVWQNIDFVRDLTYSISLSERTNKMIGGLISTKDFFYFCVIIYLFLGLCVLKLKDGRESLSSRVKAGRYAFMVISALLIGYLTSRPGLIGYYDSTTTHTETLTKNVQHILKEMGDEPLEVTSYINLLDERYFYGLPDQRNIDIARWEKILRFKSRISFKYIYYYDQTPNPMLYSSNPGKSLKQIAEMYAKTYHSDLADFKSPGEIHKIIDLLPEQNRYVMQLRYKGKTTFLRLYNDQSVFPSETEIAAALQRLMIPLPKIAFLEGESERNINKFGDKDYEALTKDITFRYALVNQGFDVETISLKNNEIPADVTALVIADPKVSFDSKVLSKIQKYISDGGNLLIAGEPGKQSILSPLLNPMHIKLLDGILIQQSDDYAPDLVVPLLTQDAVSFSNSLVKAAKDSVGVTMPGATGLSFTKGGDYTIKPLLITNERISWLKKGKLLSDANAVIPAPSNQMVMGTAGGGRVSAPVVASAKQSHPVTAIPAASGAVRAQIVPAAIGAPRSPSVGKISQGQTSVADPLAITYSPADGDLRQSMVTALSLTRQVNGHEQRIVVTGDADFLSNSELSRMRMNTANFRFNTSIFSWLSYGKFPIDTHRPESRDKHLKITAAGVVTLKYFVMGVLPGLLLIAGAILLIRRKKK